MEGTITRKEIITDEALAWGGEYAKTLDLAIGKNKEFVTAIVALNEANNKLRGSFDQKAFIENQKSLNTENQKTLGIWKEQIQLENALISTKKKNELATEGTSRALVKERLELALVNKQVKQEAMERLGLVSAYTKLNQARTDAKNKLRDLIAAENQNIKAIKEAEKAFATLDTKVRKADHAVGDFTKTVGNYPKLTSFTSGIKDLIGAFGIVGGLTAFAAVAKNIFETTKELQSLDLALKSVTGTQSEFADQQLFLSSISQKYGLEIKNLTKQFISFYVAAKDKISGKEIQEIFENISKSGSALGLSNETLERSFQAVNQMLSKGVVASEELRGQLAESMPGAIQAMTKAVQKLHPEIKNLTEKGLFEMIKSGKILANEVLPETARQLVIMTGADKAQGIETLTKLTNRLSNEWTDMIRSINETDTSGFGIFVKKIVSGLSNILTFTSLLFKSEDQLTTYFTNLGKQKGFEEFDAIMKNIGTTSKENQELVKKELLFRERETIRVNTAIVKSEKEKRASIIGGDRALFHLQTKAEEDALVKIGKSAEIIKKIKESNVKPAAIAKSDVNGESDAERKKRLEKEKSDRDKAFRDRLAAEKKLSDDFYNLQKQRLERTIQLNDLVSKDDEVNDEVRIAAAQNSQKKQIELTELTKKHSLDADKFVLDQDKLSTNEKIRLKEDAANKIIDINKKTSDEIEKINEFDAKSYEDKIKRELAEIEIKNNDAIIAEEKRFQDELALGYDNDKAKEKAAKDHERELFRIKKEGLIATAKLQIAVLNDEIAAYEAKAKEDGIITQKESDFISGKRKEVSDLSVRLIQAEGETFKENEKEKGKSVKEQSEEILQISSETLGALSDLANAFSERKIQKIDEEINKNNEYYDKQIELAGNDERQKDLLEKERDKKNAELEKKKKAAQHKQAVFDKAVTIAQIAIQTALAIIKAAPNPVTITFAAVLGAIQLATAIATPIPKYKMGRKGGPAETAWVGDGFVSEVITKGDGSNPRLTPNTPTLTNLGQGDIVHKSVEDYNRYVRASILSGFNQDHRKMSEFQSNQNADLYGKEMLEELKRNTQAIKGQKNGTVVNMPGLDINHHLWKMRNTNWS
jgi:tape measure domain-containing protein